MINSLITIGPNSLSEHDIYEFSLKTKLFRLNGSHSDLKWHKRAIGVIRKVCPDAFILMDIPGIKPRTANAETIKISKNQRVCFGHRETNDDNLKIELTKPLPNYQSSLINFSLNDGQFSFDVIETGEGFLVGASREDFELLPKKGINLPGSVYDEKKQFEIYKDFINAIVDFEIDALGLSFIQTGDVLERLKKIRPDLVLISKIENSEGLKNCADIADASDAVMIDRGDLVAEIGYLNLYNAIETISKTTKERGKPLIMATENLESMIYRELPSKSEVVSIAHSASIGVDCFMLSEETAISKNAHVIVHWLSNFLETAEITPKTDTSIDKHEGYKLDIWKSIKAYPDLPKLIMSKSGRAVSRFLAMNSTDKLFVVTDNEKVSKIVQLYSNDITLLEAKFGSQSNIELLWDVIQHNHSTIFERHHKILAVYVSNYTKKPRANTITIFDSLDFSD